MTEKIHCDVEQKRSEVTGLIRLH